MLVACLTWTHVCVQQGLLSCELAYAVHTTHTVGSVLHTSRCHGLRLRVEIVVVLELAGIDVTSGKLIEDDAPSVCGWNVRWDRRCAMFGVCGTCQVLQKMRQAAARMVCVAV